MQLEQINEIKTRRLELESLLNAPQAEKEAVTKELRELQALCVHPFATFELKGGRFEHDCPTCSYHWTTN